MCIITDEILDVSNTEILVAMNSKTKEQITVYSNKTLNVKPENYMILPVPISREPIRFIDLTGIDVFDTLNSIFQQRHRYGDSTLGSDSSVIHHNVGSYDVYECKTVDSISTIYVSCSYQLLNLLNKYYKLGFHFLLCKLKSGSEYKYHPLAYVHKILDNLLFIPTKHLHIHQNVFVENVYDKEYEIWDHDIYIYNLVSQDNMTFRKKDKKFEIPIERFSSLKTELQEFVKESKYLPKKDLYTVKYEQFDKHRKTILPDIKFIHDDVFNIAKFQIKGPYVNDDILISI